MTPAAYLVYEIVNSSRREAVIGVSDAPDLEAVRARHERLPPVWVSLWGREARATYNLVEGGLSLTDAQALAAKYAKSAVWKDFKVFVTE